MNGYITDITSTPSSSSYWPLLPTSLFIGQVIRLITQRWQLRWKYAHSVAPIPSAIVASSCPPLPPVDIVGHRGMGILAPENTLYAFHMGLTLPMSCMETDLWLTRDNIVVIVHGTADYEGDEWIPNMTWEQLHTKNPMIPRLEQVLSLLVTHPQSTMTLCLELKYIQWMDPNNMQRVLDIIQTSQLPNPHSRIMFSSFFHDNLITLHGLDAQYRTGALFNGNGDSLPSIPDMIQMLVSCHASEAHIRFNHILPHVVTALQTSGYRVMAWFGGNQDDSESELRACVGAGVTKICTNRPDRLASMCGWKSSVPLVTYATQDGK